MKVLVVLDSIRLGGAENLLVPLSRACTGAGFSIDVLTVAGPSPQTRHLLPTFQAAGVHVSHLGIRRLLQPTALPRMARAIRESECDVVHAHLEASCTLVPPAALMTRRPAVCTFHHVPERLSGRAEGRQRLAIESASRSRRVLFVSEASRRMFAALYGPRSTWAVLHNGIDLDAFAHVAAQPTDRPPTVVLVAAMRRPKGHATAIDAWPAVRTAVPGARLLLVGAGEEESSLRQRVSRLGLQDCILFEGMRHDVPRLLASSDLLVLPSETEALPTTLIEAAAAGLPVVACDVGGVREVVDDGTTGLLVPVADPEALARAVVELLRDPSRRRWMGSQARRTVEQRFDMHSWARALRREYDLALANQRP